MHTMGWMGGHLHEFIIGDRNFGMPDQDYPEIGLEREDRVTLSTALGSLKTFRYLYDFGDGWEHRVKVEKVLRRTPPCNRHSVSTARTRVRLKTLAVLPATSTSLKPSMIRPTRSTRTCSIGAADSSTRPTSTHPTPTPSSATSSSDCQCGLGATLTPQVPNPSHHLDWLQLLGNCDNHRINERLKVIIKQTRNIPTTDQHASLHVLFHRVSG